ncbi:hypothetical protein NFI96_010763 [Prochilodus magdalenae]|nr:hypothetical protein NFI96_010763 [Prochilodus magdalenae]
MNILTQVFFLSKCVRAECTVSAIASSVDLLERISPHVSQCGAAQPPNVIHRLQRIIRSAEKITGVKLPTLMDLHTSRTRKQGEKIITDPSHPGHHLFQRYPSGQRFSQIRIKTTRLQRSFFRHAITLMSS